MIFATLNSTYEVDHYNSRIRRLDGFNSATSRQGKDGEWKTFLSIGPIIEGENVTIVWEIVEDVARATQTSEVEDIS